MPDPQHPITDEALLADAIPIEAFEAEEEEEQAPAILDDGAAVSEKGRQKIRRFGDVTKRTHEWVRKPNADGTGAVHCKTFVAKMRQEALDHLDEQINEWLDAHEDVEVKFVTTAIGPMIGKMTEPALVVNLWV